MIREKSHTLQLAPDNVHWACFAFIHFKRPVIWCINVSLFSLNNRDNRFGYRKHVCYLPPPPFSTTELDMFRQDYWCHAMTHNTNKPFIQKTRNGEWMWKTLSYIRTIMRIEVFIIIFSLKGNKLSFVLNVNDNNSI